MIALSAVRRAQIHYANTDRATPALSELAQLDQWVISKLVNGQKPPFSPHTRRQCSHSNPAHWSSYETARLQLPGFTWLGFVFHDSDPYSGVDLDGCRNPETGAIEGWAQRWIDALDSYTEISPSGSGVKIWVRGTLPEQLTHSLGAHKGIEVYSTRRFFTVTGQHLAGTPAAIREAQVALDLMWAEYHKEHAPAAPRKAYTVSKGEAANERQNAGDVIARLNRANDLGDYLAHRGATLIRTRGDVRYYSGLAGDSHKGGHTYIVSPAKDGNGHIGVSYSPNGKLSTADFPRGFRWFDAILALEYGGDRIAALKALNPIQPRQKRAGAPEPATEYRTTTQVADAARKRAQRLAARNERIARIDPLIAKIDQDSAIRAFDRDLFAYHHACWSSGPEHYASIERIARAVLGLDRAPEKHEIRRVKLSHGRLIAEGYIKRTIRGSKTVKETNCWQPGDGHRVIAIKDAPITLIESSHDLFIESVIACEGGATFPARENEHADSPEAWQWAADDHSADELSALEWQTHGSFSALSENTPPQMDAVTTLSAIPQSAILPPARVAQVERLSFASYLRNLAAELGEVLDLAELAALSLAEQEACEARLIAQLADGDQAPAVAAAIADGACYMPALDWTSGGVLDLSTWRDPLELRTRAAGDVAEIAELAALLDQVMEPAKPATWSHPVRLLADAPDRELNVSCPPDVDDRRYVTFRMHWFAARQITRSFKARAWHQQQADRLLEEAEPAEAARRWAPFRPVQGESSVSQPPSRRRRQAPSVEIPQMPDDEQLVLELSTSAGGFARALVESSPPSQALLVSRDVT